MYIYIPVNQAEILILLPSPKITARNNNNNNNNESINEEVNVNKGLNYGLKIKIK
jgi:hypothetical protein